MTRSDGRPHGMGVYAAGPAVIYGADGMPLAAWPNALAPHRSPCRNDQAKGLRQHRCSAAHADMVEGYRAWRETEHAAAEAATNGHATELADYWRARGYRVTLGTYLIMMRDETRE